MVDSEKKIIEEMIAKVEVARLILARPHPYPPNANPPFEWESGVAVRKLSRESMTEELWMGKKCSHDIWCAIIIEWAPNGVRELGKGGQPKILSFTSGGPSVWEACFANCMMCWKSQKRDFFDSNRTPHPYSVHINHPSLPQLGCCGCVICNECVLRHFEKSPDVRLLLPCPYCAKVRSFNRDVKAWPLGRDIFTKELRRKGVPEPPP
jgi:hypothetical protein